MKRVFLAVKQCPNAVQEGFHSSLSLAQSWPAQRAAPILVRHEALNQRAHAVSSQPTFMVLPAQTKEEDKFQTLSIFIQCVILSGTCAALWGSLCAEWAGILSLPFTFPLSSVSFSPAGSPCFLVSPSPSQVEMMYDLCCQPLSCVTGKLIMTRSSLLFEHHTLFVTLLVSTPCVWQVCIETERGWSTLCVRQRESQWWTLLYWCCTAFVYNSTNQYKTTISDL